MKTREEYDKTERYFWLGEDGVTQMDELGFKFAIANSQENARKWREVDTSDEPFIFPVEVNDD